jgi:hypothetical protein
VRYDEDGLKRSRSLLIFDSGSFCANIAVNKCSADLRKCAMAQRTTVTMIDDVDGSEAAETVTFGLDGRVYEIDLSEKNAIALRRALERFVASARKSGGRAAAKGSAGYTGSGASREELQAMRKWAIENGYKVALRGRISQAIQDAYSAR